MSFGLMTYDSAIDRAAAGLLVLLTALVALSEWGVNVPPLARHLATLSVIVLLSLRVRVAQLAFVLAGIALTLWLMVSSADWRTITLAALDRAAFIAAFFTALATLRNVAATSPSRASGGWLSGGAAARAPLCRVVARRSPLCVTPELRFHLAPRQPGHPCRAIRG